MVNMEHVMTVKYFEVGCLILLQQIIFSQSNFTERMLIGDLGKVAMGEIPSLMINQDKSEIYHLVVLL